jgi:hypothetical protein
MTAVVVVELPQPSPSAQQVEVLLEACSRAAAPSRCELGQGDMPVSPSRLRATVHAADTASTAVTVQVQGHNDSLAQTLTFRERDDLSERWRAVGLAIGTLASEMTVSPESSADQPAPAIRTAPAPTATRSSLAPFGAIGALAGPGFNPGPWRVGGWLRAGIDLRPIHLMLLADGSYSVAARNEAFVDGSWVGLALGVGSFHDVDALDLRLQIHAAGTVDRIHAGVRVPSDGASDTGSRWVPGARMGVGVQWPSRSWLALSLDADGWWTPSPTHIRVHDRLAAVAPSTGVILRVGFRVGL